jgi:hypothetical protein
MSASFSLVHPIDGPGELRVTAAYVTTRKNLDPTEPENVIEATIRGGEWIG